MFQLYRLTDNTLLIWGLFMIATSIKKLFAAASILLCAATSAHEPRAYFAVYRAGDWTL